MRGILAFLLLTVLLCGCAGAGDWASEPLAGDYALWRLSGYRVELVRERESGGADSVIGALVYRVAYNEDFICVQRTDPPEGNEGLPIVPEVAYYILRVSDGAVFGPYTAAEYKEQCDELQITSLSDWKYATEFRP